MTKLREGPMDNWQPIETAPESVVVRTKIDDGKTRNDQDLVRFGRLWFFPDKSMYVYYTPTHWMPKLSPRQEAATA